MSHVEELISVVRELPSEAVDELLGMARTLSARPSSATPYVPVKLRGLWKTTCPIVSFLMANLSKPSMP